MTAARPSRLGVADPGARHGPAGRAAGDDYGLARPLTRSRRPPASRASGSGHPAQVCRPQSGMRQALAGSGGGELDPLRDVVGGLDVQFLTSMTHSRNVVPVSELGEQLQVEAMSRLAYSSTSSWTAKRRLVELQAGTYASPVTPTCSCRSTGGRRADSSRHIGHDRVEERREVGRGVGVDRRRRLVDLDERGALGDQRTHLVREDRDKGFRGRDAVG